MDACMHAYNDFPLILVFFVLFYLANGKPTRLCPQALGCLFCLRACCNRLCSCPGGLNASQPCQPGFYNNNTGRAYESSCMVRMPADERDEKCERFSHGNVSKCTRSEYIFIWHEDTICLEFFFPDGSWCEAPLTLTQSRAKSCVLHIMHASVKSRSLTHSRALLACLPNHQAPRDARRALQDTSARMPPCQSRVHPGPTAR